MYVADITFGPLPHQRGHWQDRLAAMDTDIATMEQALATAGENAPGSNEQASAAIEQVVARPARAAAVCRHQPPGHFVPGTPLRLSLRVELPAAPSLVRVHYRHVNQAERYQVAQMHLRGGWPSWPSFPASYTDSPFPLQYYFELKKSRARLGCSPGSTAT